MQVDEVFARLTGRVRAVAAAVFDEGWLFHDLLASGGPRRGGNGGPVGGRVIGAIGGLGDSVEQRVELLDGQVAVELAVELHDRRDGAGAQAGHAHHRETAIRGVAVGPQFEPALEVLGQSEALFDVAGGAPADLDDVLPQGREAELVVEGGDSVDARHRRVESGRDFGHGGL